MLSKKQIKRISYQVESVLRSALDEGLHPQEVDPSRVTKLRISSFPFCHVRWFLDLPRTTAKKHKVSSASRYFTSVGHVLHAVMQFGLDSVDLSKYSVSIIADWKCAGCGFHARMQKKPAKCDSCGSSSWKFEEVAIEEENVSGHIDTILSFQDGSKEFWIVIDYKTTSIYAVDRKPLPYIENCYQISAYVGRLHAAGKPVLPLALLVYTPRDNPWRFVIKPVEVDFEEEERRFNLYKKRFVRIASASSREDLVGAVSSRPCRNGPMKPFEGCAWSKTCAGPKNSEKTVERMAHVMERVQHKLPILK